jgi:hypothetical protein
MTVTEREERLEMHPYISQELAKIKIAEELE